MFQLCGLTVRACSIPKDAYSQLQRYGIVAGVSFEVVENHELYSRLKTQHGVLISFSLTSAMPYELNSS